MFATLALLTTLGTASASNADTRAFDLTTEVEAWPTTEVDSGWWPESGPVRIRTVLFAEGFAGIEMPGQSIVEQGANGIVHRVVPADADSEASVEVNIAAELYLSLNVAGYSWEDILHEQTIDFDVSQAFSDFAFADEGGTELNLPMESIEVFEIDQGIFPMVDVVVSGTLSPTANIAINTDAIETDWGAFTAADQQVSTAGGPTSMDALGSLDAMLSMVIQGHAEVCITFIDCYGNFNYDFALDPVEHTQELTYDTVTLSHSTMGSDADGPATAKAGGCSSAPTGPVGPISLLMAMMALAYRRRD
tara:strand:- start:2528 stop:3445 length:918 start_codon:yes stop_codon:yes gene_type:complete